MRTLTTPPNLSELRNSQKALKAVLWDMDGTLLNSEYIHVLITKDILKNYLEKFEGDLEELEKECKGFSDQQFIEHLSKNYNIYINLEEFIESKNKRFKESLSTHTKDHIISKDVLNLLEELKENNILMGLVTSSEHDIAHYLLERLDLKSYFHFVLTKQETIKTKPDPTPYLMAQEILNLKKEECLIFEDSKVGIAAAKSAKIPYLIANWY